MVFGIQELLQQNNNNTICEQLVISDRAKWAQFARAMGVIWTTECFVCGGHGHEEIDCGSRAQLDVAARGLGVSWEWGAVKGALYYEEWVTLNPVRASARSARAAARSRSRHRPHHR